MFLHHGLDMPIVSNNTNKEMAQKAKIFWKIVDEKLEKINDFWKTALKHSRSESQDSNSNFKCYYLNNDLIFSDYQSSLNKLSNLSVI